MKKALLAVSALCLVGCSILTGGIPYQEYKTFNSYGVSRTEDMKALLDIFPINNLDIGYTKEWDGFRRIMDGIKKKEYAPQDIIALMQTAQNFHGDDPANLLASPLFANRFNSDIIVPSARRVHNNENIEKIILENIYSENIQIRDRKEKEDRYKKNQELLKRQQEAAQKKRDAEEARQNAINRFGKDIFDRCGGEIISVSMPYIGQDPYAYVGKCVGMQIPRFVPQNFGMRQWIGPNALLSTLFFGEVTSTFVVTADEHIKMDVPLVAIGVDPMQYQNGLGVLQTPVTFKVLRFY